MPRNPLVCEPAPFEIQNPLPDETTMTNVKCRIKNEMKAGCGSNNLLFFQNKARIAPRRGRTNRGKIG